MNTSSDLRNLERTIYRRAVDDGLWDVLLAALLSMFAIAPLLSARLGDFLSSAVFLPILALVYLLVHLLRRHIVEPRLGTVRFGPARRERLRIFTLLMLALNVVFFVGGIVAATRPLPSGWSVPIGFSLVALLMFSIAAFFLQIPRLYLYATLVAVAPLLGEWLFRRGQASHHGFPLTFGAVAILIAATGVLRFYSLARRPPQDADTQHPRPSHA